MTLSFEVFVTPSVAVVSPDPPPGEPQRLWPPMAATLIYGERDAVLVDAFVTVGQATALADWVASKGRRLTHLYATHGHGDHFFGASTILERFPGARFVAHRDAVAVMQKHVQSPSWRKMFPGQVAEKLAVAEALESDRFSLEDHDLVVVPLGHTDTDGTTCLHVPSIGLVVAGDGAYNGMHLWLGESPDQARRRLWIAAIDKMASLSPRAVVASHKRAENADTPDILASTKKYILDFEQAMAATATAEELYDRMKAAYPDLGSLGALWTAAQAVKPRSGKPAAAS